MRSGRLDLLTFFVPPAVALFLTLAYFFLTRNWTNLGNPLASMVALAAGVTGFGASVGVDRLRRSRRRTRRS